MDHVRRLMRFIVTGMRFIITGMGLLFFVLVLKCVAVAVIISHRLFNARAPFVRSLNVQDLAFALERANTRRLPVNSRAFHQLQYLY
jgi:hypothetical protein